MRLLFLIVVFALGAMLTLAVDIKNIRVRVSPDGADRKDNKLSAGDTLYFSCEIQGLKADADTKFAEYSTTLEVLDQRGKKIHIASETKKTKGNNSNETPMFAVPAAVPLGNYTVRYSIVDTKAKEAKAFRYMFVVK